MTEALKITCTRCRGRGYRDTHVVYAGAPGTCFLCAGFGEIYKDKFYRAFGVGQRFVGVTRRVWLNEGNPNNGVFKEVRPLRELDEVEGIENHLRSGEYVQVWGGTSRYVEITEAQARDFVKRFGYNTPVRVGDSLPEHNLARAELAARVAARRAAREQQEKESAA